MDIDELSIEAKCENLMNVVVESRKRFGKMCIDYEQKTSLVENKMLNLQLETISNFRVKPKNTVPNWEAEDATDLDRFSDEILQQRTRIDMLRKRLKNTQEVVVQLKADVIGGRLRDSLSTETMLAKARAKVNSH